MDLLGENTFLKADEKKTVNEKGLLSMFHLEA